MAQHQICGKHQDNPTNVYCATCERMKVEHKIVMTTVRALVSTGYNVGVNDGEELTLEPTGDVAAIENALFTTDEDYLIARHSSGDKSKNGWVFFVYGNSGPDVCNDYTMSLREVMKAVEKFAERQTPHNG